MRRSTFGSDAAALFGLAAAVGCQCFAPVDQLGPDRPIAPDAGAARADGRADAGLPDAGRSCSTAADCKQGEPSVTWCSGFGQDAGPSCISGRCVLECPGGRTCGVTLENFCLSCDRSFACPRWCFGSPSSYEVSIEQATCAHWPGTSEQVSPGRLRLVRGDAGSCQVTVLRSDGGAFGTLWMLDNGELIALLEPFPNSLCTGSQLPTGVPRAVVNCPGCQMVWAGFW